MSNVPDSLNFTADHEWVEMRGDIARVGITDYAQAALGDIVYVQLPKAVSYTHLTLPTNREV